MDNTKTLSKILESIKNEVSSANYRTWFSNTSIASLDQTRLTIAVPSAFIKEQLNIRYLPLIQKAVDTTLNKHLEIVFIVDASKTTTMTAAQTAEEPEEEFFQPVAVHSTPIVNPKYTLDNFVVGLSNNVAYAAAQAVVQNPGNSYNPLFIYGGTGVGKTHLMLGIGNAILAKNPYYKIIYCSSEKFTNDYVESIQNRKMGELRAKYRSADLLLVDDVQFFSGREGTQEEFFHTFNELTTKNSQLVLTSDRPPSEMQKLEDRLKSRFQGGLMVDIQTPDLDTRVAILREKCHEKGDVLPDDCLNLIAASFETNARELEGKLIGIIQILKIQNTPPSVETIKPLLGMQANATSTKITHKQVFSSVCNYFNIKQADLTGPNRKKELVLPRHIAMYILSEELKLTVEHIGQLLGGRDHTTVMHGRDRIKSLLSTDREVQRLWTELKQALAGSN